ncbi:MAG TPA: glycosyltransferase, partial [Flavisolibacter sp.]
MKKKLLILTLNDYIIYQPTILNLYDFLTPHFDVTVVSVEPKFATKQKDETRNVVYLQPQPAMSELLQKADFLFSKAAALAKRLIPSVKYHYLYYNWYLPHLLKQAVRKQRLSADIIIAVDLQTLYVAQQIFGSVHFLSLEIDEKTNRYYRRISLDKIRSVFIQSPMRYEFMFNGATLKTFYVQNAPVFLPEVDRPHTRTDFVWAGAIDKRLAVMDCIEFFEKNQQYRLVLKGGGNSKTISEIEAEYEHLIRSNTIEINQEYLPSDQFIEFLSQFRIGFCFYSWELIAASFNYRSAPSGKLFMCLAAGTPVVACDIPGFQFVKEFKAGVLIPDYEPETIARAIEKIESDFEAYSAGAFAAARHYSFDKTVKPYIDFLVNESN